jgi:hypothetical protein
MSGTADGRPGHRRILGGLAAGATVVALAISAGAAWDGQQTVILGDAFSSAFQGDPGVEMHRFDFYAPTGATLKAKIKVEKGDDLAPAWQVFTIAGDEVDLGTALKGTQIKNYKFEEGGAFYMKVTSTSGTGRYEVSLKGSKIPTKYKEKGVANEYHFEAVQGASMTAKVKKGPTIGELHGPFGPVDIGGGGVTQLKNFILPFSGEYVLVFTDDDEEADEIGDVDIKLKNPKSVKYYFDATESTRGMADLARTEWLGSGHADFLAEAFRHWDEDGEISTRCATCHSSFGYQDFVGADGTDSNVLGNPQNQTDNPAALGSTVDCNACHNTETPGLDTVQFPSGEIVDGLGNEARCMQCHQGRESGKNLEEHIQSVLEEGDDDDTIKAGLRFLNIHYYAAGASLFGADAWGAYEYLDEEGNREIYNHRFPHVSTIDNCQECHNQHTLELRYEQCAECHEEGANPALDETPEWVYDIRHEGSVLDYDGDGNADEGLYHELDTLGTDLLEAMEAYAERQGFPILYDSHSYPYWFNDNGEGANYGNRYQAWTARLLRAAYNYQYWQKDPGLFAHNAKYGIEFLYDTLESLHEVDEAFVPNFDKMFRNDSGHFDNTSRAFRYFDGSGSVRSSCAQCHSPGGFAFAARFGIPPIESYPPGDGFTCEQCHLTDTFDQPVPDVYYVDQVTFPSGVQIKNDPENQDDSFLCMTCHQGRQSKTQVDEKIAEEPGGPHRFSNIHYLAAGPTLYGADAAVGYEYDENSFVGEQSYEAKWEHAGPADDAQCVFCHLTDHTFLPQSTVGCGCHGNPENIQDIRLARGWDYNGNGNDTTERLVDEVATYANRLMAAMHDYTDKMGLPPFEYVDNYPYFVYAEDGPPDPEGEPGDLLWEAGDGYGFDDELLKASFNWQFWNKDHGAWAHNTFYVMQLLYDSIDDLQLAAEDNETPLDFNYLTTNPFTEETEILSIKKDGAILFLRRPSLAE